MQQEQKHNATANQKPRKSPKDAQGEVIVAEIEETTLPNVNPYHAIPDYEETTVELGKAKYDKRQRMKGFANAVIDDIELGSPEGMYKVAKNIGISRALLYQWHNDPDWKQYQGLIDLVKRLCFEHRIEHAILAQGNIDLKSIGYAMGYLARIAPVVSKSEQTIKTEKHNPAKLSNDKLMKLAKGGKVSEVLADKAN